jgi:hypothetical protein
MSKAPKDNARPLFASGKAPPVSLGAAADDVRMKMALRQVGFDPAAAAPKPVPQPVPRPVVAKAPPATAPDDRLTLRRREWLADTMERQRALSPIASGLLTAQDLSSEQFLHDFYAPGRPVVIKGAMDDWPALLRWTPDYLAATVGDARIEYQGGRRDHADFELHKDRHKAVMPFARFMAMIAKGQDNDAYITAYNSAANAAAFAPLEPDMRYLDAWLTRAHGMLWVGPKGTFTPLHFDLTNNLLAQVTGTKRVLLIPPSQTRHLAHRTHVFSDVLDVTDPARLALYPAARNVLRYEVTLTAGDLLFIPIGWWHQVRSDSFSVMATYTNFRWPNVGHEEYPSG